MVKQRDIRAFKARYHRNGSDEGFYLCEFTYLRGKAAVKLRAVVFDAVVAVFSDDLNERWRGDDFAPAMREALAAVESAQPETLYERNDHAEISHRNKLHKNRNLRGGGSG